jgi:hypothetical protein
MERAVVRVKALLRGMGCKADCVLETWQETSSTGRVFTRAVIAEEPPNLPDGIYMIVVGGQNVFTRKWGGSWLLTFLPPEVDTAKCAA